MSSTPIFFATSKWFVAWQSLFEVPRSRLYEHQRASFLLHCLTTIHICSERTFVQVVLSVLGKTNMSLRSTEDHSKGVSKSLPYHVKLALGLAATTSEPPQSQADRQLFHCHPLSLVLISWKLPHWSFFSTCGFFCFRHISYPPMSPVGMALWVNP